MPKIVSVGTAVPEYIFPQEKIREYAKLFFSESFNDIDRLLSIFESSNIRKRHFSVPFEWFEINHTFSEKNKIYQENAISLGCKAIEDCLTKTIFSPEEIDHIIFVSSTGLSTPSIEAFIANELKMRLDLKRTPIWGLGCAGGAVGLSRAAEYARAYPKSKVITCAVELCGLTFLRHDMSKSNLVATSLFADGGAAALITGDEVEENIDETVGNKTSSPKVIDSLSTIWPETTDVMGWEIMNEGFKVIFSKDIPNIVKKRLVPQVEKFLKNHNLSIDDLQFFIAHPGGTKVIQAYAESLGLPDEYFTGAKEILANYGNMSAPTVLFVLKEALNSYIPKGGYGLLAALGPGFSSELILLQW